MVGKKVMQNKEAKRKMHKDQRVRTQQRRRKGKKIEKTQQ